MRESLIFPCGLRRRAASFVWLLCALAPLGARASFDADLQGLSTNSTTWIGGNLQGWKELDYVPCRVFFAGGPANKKTITVEFDHFKVTTPGIENLTGWTPSTNVVISSAPVLYAPVGVATWSYTFKVDVLDRNPGWVEFRARLSAGAHLNTGSSLALGGTPALGSLQIFKPAAADGSPDLAIEKSGPAIAAPLDTITYTVTWTNRSTASTHAVGVQITDILPPEVTYMTNSASCPANCVGDTLIWDLGDVEIGASGSFTYQAIVQSGLAYASTFHNYAQILSSENDTNYADNVSVVTTTVLFNRPPTPADDAYSVNEDDVLIVPAPGVLANDTDADGDPFTAVLATNPRHGTVTLQADGSFVYTPDSNYNGPDRFTYIADDGSNVSASATINLTVLPMNDPPVARNDSYATDEDTPLLISSPGVLANDTDIDGDLLTAALVTGPSHGSLSLNGNGSFTYTPADNYYGSDSFTYKASDGIVETAPATVSLTVRAVNDAPVAANDSYATDEDTTLTISAPGVLANDTDIEGNALTALLVTAPSHGALTLNSNGSFTYTPAANYSGPDSFTYKARDASSNSAAATVNLTVRPVNDAPVAVNDSYATDEDTALNLAAPGVLANDTDVDGDSLIVVLVTGTGHGTVTLNSNGSFTYTPVSNYIGPDTFTYKARDASVYSTTATVNLTVRPVNHPPVASNESYATDEDTALTIAAPGVLANDTDVDGNPLTAVLVVGPGHGTLMLNANGGFTYTPSANYNGPDSFTYKANDGSADSATATVNLTLRPVNDAPVAANDSYATDEDTALTIAAPGVLANDTDIEGDSLTAVLVTNPGHGTVSFNANGSFTYTPASNYNGSDSFTYKTRDASADSIPATVTLTVRPVNDPPVASNDSYATDEDIALTITAPGVLANDTDIEGGALTAVLVTGPSHGTVTLDTNGGFIYTPSANYNGLDSFTYKASDASADSATATVNLTIRAVNDAPAAADDSYATDEDNALVIAAPGVLANDTDLEGGALTAALVTGPSHGTATLNVNGGFTYTPSANYNGPDSFTYKANDGTADSGTATVNLTIRPVNDAPVAANDSYATDENIALTIAAPGVLVNDTDSDGDGLTAVLVTGPSHGTLALNADGSFTYTSAASYNGPDSFTYKARDASADSIPATVSLTVRALNDPPVAANDSYATDEEVALTIAAPGVLANDTDIDGDSLTAVLVIGPSHGALALNANGSFTYTPAANYNGPDSFTYKARDASADSIPATVSLTVRPVNDAPVALNDSYATDEDTALTIAAPGVLANDTDIDGDSLTAVLVTGPSHGTLALNADGSFTYTPAGNYNGSDSFTYKARDASANSASATVNLTVRPVNDAPVAANDGYATDEDTALTIAAPGVLANDTDVEGNALTAVLVTGPSHGTLALNANGGFTYTPAANYNGPDSFTYKARDASADSAAATVNLTVRPVNDAPVALNDSYATDEETALTIAAPGVLANDSDIDGDSLTAVLVTGPSHGTLALNPDGSFTYTPAGNYNGPDSFTYKARDASANSATATANLTVRPVNDAPVAANDSYATDEDMPLTIAAPGVLANDTDIDGDSLTAVLVTGPGHGTLALNANGSFTYTPSANYNGPDSFTYKARDASADSVAATVSLTVRSLNDPPVAANDSYATDEDAALNIVAPGVLANDTDLEGDGLAAALVAGPSHGTLTLNSNGSFTYTPAANYNGPDAFTYRASDGSANSASATVNLTIRPVNDAPVAANDSYATDEEIALTIAAPGVLANDSDLEGDSITAVLVAGPSHGALTLNPDGSFVYTPSADYSGPDSFTYKARDASADSIAATVNLTVRPVNDLPVSRDDNYATALDTVLAVAAPGVLANDSDADGDILTAVLITGPSHGTVTLNSNGSFSYTPAASYSGADSFTYHANDGSADSLLATVNLSVHPVNHAPVALNDSYQTDEDTALTIAAPGVLGNDTDSDGDILTAVLVNGPSHGTLALNSNGSFTYTPVASYSGPDSFTYKATDGSANALATVSLTIRAVNDAPIAGNASYSTDEDIVLTVAAPGVLSNVTDADGNSLTATLVTGPSHGTLTLNPDGSFVYTPATNYNGSDSFTYKANDGTVDSSVATVTLTIRPVNDAPVARNASYGTDEDTVLTVAAPGVLSNATDVEGNSLTAVLVTGPSHGTLTLNPDGSFVYTPDPNYNGPDSFTYKANDGSANSAVATVNLTIRPVNDAPVAGNASYTTDEDTVLTIGAPGVLSNVTDVDGNTVIAVLVTGPSHGTLTLNSDGSFVYTPDPNYNGTDSFTYKANDGTTNSPVATVTLTIRSVNDAPVAGNASYTTDEDTVLTVGAPGVLSNVTDVDGNTVTAVLVTGPSHGTLTLNPDGSFVYTPDPNYNGTDSFTYKANDGTTNSPVATVTLTIRAVNDVPLAGDDAYTTYEDTALTVPAPGVLANDTDADGDTLTAALVTGPSHGTLALNSNGSFTYTPAGNYNGTDAFTYAAADRSAQVTATVTLTIKPVNDVPSFVKGPDQLVSLNSGAHSVPNWASAISAGPADEAGQALTFQFTSNSNPSLFSTPPALSADGTLTFTAAPAAFGTATLAVRLHDDGGLDGGGVDTSAEQTFAITVNSPPTANVLSPTNGTIYMAPGAFSVMAAAADPDGSVTNLELFSGTNLLMSAASSTCEVALTNLAAGAYQFVARATDNLGATGTSVPVTVQVGDDIPIAIITSMHLNLQSGLYTETVRIQNVTPTIFPGVRLLILDLATNVVVWNASGKTSDGIPFVQINQEVSPGGTLDFTIEYYVPNRVKPTRRLVAYLTGAAEALPDPTGTPLQVTRLLRLADGTLLIEWNSLANRTYYVQYSADGSSWKTALPAVTGTGTRQQWIDNGPPKTDSLPPASAMRFYRLLLVQ